MNRRTRGAALLAAMITVALVATLAAAALWRQWRGVEVEGAERARVQASWLLTGALDWGRLILAGDYNEDRQKGQFVDHLAEPWAVPLAEARLSTFLAAGEANTDIDRDAFLAGQITDLQSRMNVMNLLAGDQVRALERFANLFRSLGLRGSELGVLHDNLVRAQQAMQGAAAPGGDAPLLPRRFEQLAWLGLAPDTLAALRPHVTLLPITGSPTPINLNTASAQVIAAVLSVDLAAAQRLVARRESRFFDNALDAIRLIDPTALPDTWISINSSFFEVRGRLRLDDVALEELAVVQRVNTPQRRGVVTLWRERAALAVPPAGGSAR